MVKVRGRLLVTSLFIVVNVMKVLCFILVNVMKVLCFILVYVMKVLCFMHTSQCNESVEFHRHNS